MKIYKRSYEHTLIGTQYDHTNLQMTIVFDDGELDPKLMKRFRSVQVQQKHYCVSELRTWIKGCHSAWFGEEQTKTDPHKKFIWNLIHRFMEDNPIAISANWKINKH
jgi:hypothetical protein